MKTQEKCGITSENESMYLYGCFIATKGFTWITV